MSFDFFYSFFIFPSLESFVGSERLVPFRFPSREGKREAWEGRGGEGYVEVALSVSVCLRLFFLFCQFILLGWEGWEWGPTLPGLMGAGEVEEEVEEVEEEGVL